jgi:hypothetical protein
MDCQVSHRHGAVKSFGFESSLYNKILKEILVNINF